MGTLPPPVVGDPAGMRALAAALRSTAGQLDAVDSGVYGRVSGLSFSGPTATQLDETIRGWHAEVSGTVDELQATAALLERSAADVEAEQLARARLQRQLEEARP